MTNLLEETTANMANHGLRPGDVSWVGSRDGKYAVDWAHFTRIADLTYDNGYGGQEVANDLVVVFRTGQWLERHEYDGSEWWEFKGTPVPSDGALPFELVVGKGYWSSIHERNRPGVEDDDEEDDVA